MKLTSLYALTGLVVGVIFLLSGCGWFDGPSPGSILDPTDGTSPANDFESVVSAAIDRAVVSEKDLPDYGLLPDKSRIIVSKITSAGDTLSAGALPAAESVEFVLALPETIQEKADDGGDFLYLRIGAVEISEGDAIVSISTSWAVGSDSDVVYLSGGGYQLRYRRMDGNWVFDRILVTWIS